MNTAILIGSAVGASAGLTHAAGLARKLFARADFAHSSFALGGILTPLYYGLWTLLLWMVFGSYVLYLWLAACAVYGVHLLWLSWSPAGRR